MDTNLREEAAKEILAKLRKRPDLSRLSDQALLACIAGEVKDLDKLRGADTASKGEMIDRIYSMIRGYDVLDELMADPAVTEIMVNRYDSIFIEKGGRLCRVNRAFSSQEKYQDVVQKIVASAGREVHQRQPIVDCQMKDGSRVNVVLDPIAHGDIAMTIRRFPKQVYSLDDLVANGTLPPEAARFLRLAVQARLNLFISGGTGSGKTTLLNALAREIQPSERVISIEDARELNFENMENWISLEARRPNASGQGEVTIRDLIRASLRMRPDRIIVGEVRGPEAIDMLQSMNTGHDGSFSTGHANSIRDMQFRLETMVLSGHEGLPIQAIRQQIGAAIDLFVHVSRMRDRSRKLVAIEETVVTEAGLTYHPLFRYDYSEEGGGLKWTGESVERAVKFQRMGIEDPLDFLRTQ